MSDAHPPAVRHGPLNALFIANLVALLGKQLSLIALPWFVLTTTGSAERAGLVGFVIFLPFLVIDLVVSAVLMALGMMMLPPVMVSLPFKLLLFVLVDGWSLITQALVASYK